MSSEGVVANVLYVARDGTIRSGRLIEGGAVEGLAATTLVSRTGEALAPDDVRALLALSAPREAQRAALLRAHEAGYRVEEA